MRSKDSDEEYSKVGWNLSQSLIQEIGSFLRGANILFVRGNYQAALSNLMAVKMRIIQGLDKTERDDFSKKEQEIITITNNISSLHSWSKNYNELLILLRPKIWELYNNYNALLMDTLEKLGYTIQAKKDTTIMSA